MFVRAYLRASTEDQNANRARSYIERFAQEQGFRVAAWYVENESGAKLARPELMRLLSDSHPGDVLLVEQIDRLSRLTKDDWESLKAMIRERKVRVVGLDLPTSYQLLNNAGDFHGRMLEAINDMMLDMLAAISRKDYDDRRRRQAQGVAKAKAEGKYSGRKPDEEKRAIIRKCLDKGMSWSEIQSLTKASRSTIATVKKSMDKSAMAVSTQ